MMLAIFLLCVLPSILHQHAGFGAAGFATRPAPDSATIVAADGELLTIAAVTPTTLIPPSAPQWPGPGETDVPASLVEDAKPVNPAITPAPGTAEGTVGVGAKFVQTTYYSCVTMGTYSHCGWHEPILDASNTAPSRGRVAMRAVLAAVAASVVSGLVLGP